MAKSLLKVLNKTLDTAIILVCVLLLFIGGYSLLDNLWLYQNANDSSVLRYKPRPDEPIAEEKKISENQVGWISIDDTSIDYPLMQGVDNYEFLNKDPYGAFSLSGSIFLDSANDPELRDDYSLIYGHHMDRGAMFGALDHYLGSSYYESHRTGQIVTAKTVYELRIFAIASADATDPVIFDPRERTREEIIAFLEQNALRYDELPEGQRIVALSTCTSASDTGRLVVFGTIREKGGEQTK